MSFKLSNSRVASVVVDATDVELVELEESEVDELFPQAVRNKLDVSKNSIAFFIENTFLVLINYAHSTMFS